MNDARHLNATSTSGTHRDAQNKIDGWVYRPTGDKTQSFGEGTALYSVQESQVCVTCVAVLAARLRMPTL